MSSISSFERDEIPTPSLVSKLDKNLYSCSLFVDMTKAFIGLRYKNPNNTLARTNNKIPYFKFTDQFVIDLSGKILP